MTDIHLEIVCDTFGHIPSWGLQVLPGFDDHASRWGLWQHDRVGLVQGCQGTYPFYILGQMNPKGLLMFIPYPLPKRGIYPYTPYKVGWNTEPRGMNKICQTLEPGGLRDCLVRG